MPNFQISFWWLVVVAVVLSGYAFNFAMATRYWRGRAKHYRGEWVASLRERARAETAAPTLEWVHPILDHPDPSIPRLRAHG